LKSNEFTKARRVVVFVGFGISESLEERVEFNELSFQSTSTSGTTSNVGDVLNDLLCVFGLTSTRFSGDEHGLILTIANHHSVGSISNSEDVRGNFVPPLATVEINHVRSIDGDLLVRVDSHTEKSGVGIDEVFLVTFVEIVEDSWFIQVGQVSAVVNTIKLGGVHGMTQRGLELFLTSIGSGDGVSTRLGKNFTGDETQFLVRNPKHLFAAPSGNLETSVRWILQVFNVVGLLDLSSCHG